MYNLKASCTSLIIFQHTYTHLIWGHAPERGPTQWWSTLRFRSSKPEPSNDRRYFRSRFVHPWMIIAVPRSQPRVYCVNLFLEPCRFGSDPQNVPERDSEGGIRSLGIAFIPRRSRLRHCLREDSRFSSPLG